MIPYLEIPSLKLGPVEIHAFGVLVALGFYVGSLVAARFAKTFGQNPIHIHNVSLLCIVFGLFGAHLAHILEERPGVIFSDPKQILMIWSGISSFGGFVGAGIAVIVYFHRKKLPFRPFADALMMGLTVGWIFGRTGCYTAHDHPGNLSNFFLAVKYPAGARHDLGFYEMLWALFTFLFLYFLSKSWKSRRPGELYAFVLVFYGIFRFFIDFLRASDVALANERYGGLLMGQYFAVLFLLLGAWMFWRTRFGSTEEA